MIEKLKDQDIYAEDYQYAENYPYIDDDGCVYKYKKEYLQIKILGFCGCGNPDEVMVYVRDFLVKLEKQEWSDYEDMPYMFLIYWADDKGFTEHGSTARCSWLTEKGKELLKDIEWCLENELKKEKKDNTQEELFNEIIFMKEKIQFLASYLQNDFEKMIEDGHVTNEILTDSIVNMKKDFSDVINKLIKLREESTNLIDSFINHKPE